MITKLYEEILGLLIEAELAARNEQWPTCGTACRRAMELAFKQPLDKDDANG